jgi:hypothetical protein
MGNGSKQLDAPPAERWANAQIITVSRAVTITCPAFLELAPSAGCFPPYLLHLAIALLQQ